MPALRKTGTLFMTDFVARAEVDKLRALVEGLAASAGRSSGGSGGGASVDFLVTSGNADPVADPGVTNAVYTNFTTGSIWSWNDSAGEWILL